MTQSEITNFLWKIADLLRDDFKRGKYADVILPFTVLRRIDGTLAPTKARVREQHEKLKSKLEPEKMGLEQISGYPFYNTSKYDFETLYRDSKNLRQNLLHYINGFSPNMLEILEKFKFPSILQDLENAGILFMVFEKFVEVDLSPKVLTNHDMGTVFEELIRRFNEMVDENPGEHFTPREVVRLMVRLIIAPEADKLKAPGVIRTLYDPACGTGGMLSLGKDLIREINRTAQVGLFGQEVNPETWAVCQADMLIKTDPSDKLQPKIAEHSTLSRDAFPDSKFDYMICNPPYGKEWKKDRSAVEAEHARGKAGRFSAGLPRISDGQLLFLQTMIAKMEPVNGEYSRIAIIMNGSPLFTGDAGSGESEIRRWILENDWLEALIALPDQMFYNTPINTYVWVLTNKKAPERIGKVQLIDARELYGPMRRSLGDKRHELKPEHIEEIYRAYSAFEDGEKSKLFDIADFGYRKITVERPLRLNFQITPERIERLWEQTAFKNLDKSLKRKGKEAAMRDRNEGSKEQVEVLEVLKSMDAGDVYKDREEFRSVLGTAFRSKGSRLSAAIEKSILAALGERDEEAEICRDRDGNPEPDSELRDFENVPLKEDIREYFEREVLPHVPDAWINDKVRDAKDGKVGKVGYEINFNRYFYKYTPPRPLEEIDADIKALEKEILEMLREVTT